MKAVDIPLIDSKWLTEFNRFVANHRQKYAQHEFARDALSRLEATGVSRDEILTDLYFHTHPDAIRARRHIAVEAAGLAMTIKQMTSDLETTACRIEKSAPLGLRSESQSSAIDSLREAGRCLEPLTRYYEEIASRYKNRNVHQTSGSVRIEGCLRVGP